MAREFSVTYYYERVRELGQGGMGIVYLARKISRIKKYAVRPREVAIKIPLPSKLKKGGIEDIVNEANAIMGLNEPNVVRLEGIASIDPSEIGIISSERELPFLELEYLDGGSLYDFIELHRKLNLYIPTHVAAYIIREVAKGLKQAYEAKDETGESRKILHRDLCPRNIGFLKNGTVKIMDYGIAVAAETKEAAFLQGFSGKPPYASTEQIRFPLEIFKRALSGERYEEEKALSLGKLTIQSDIYSLGVVGFEIMHNANPFIAEIELTTAGIHDAIKLLQAHLDAREKCTWSGVCRGQYMNRENHLQQEAIALDDTLTTVIVTAMDPTLEQRQKHPQEIIDDIEKMYTIALPGALSAAMFVEYYKILRKLESMAARKEDVRKILKTTSEFNKWNSPQSLEVLFRDKRNPTHPFICRECF